MSAASSLRRKARRAAAGALATLASVLLLAAGLFGPAAHAEGRIGVEQAQVAAHRGYDPGVFVDAQFQLQLPPALVDAVRHGIALYFVIDLEVARSRWYWFDKRVIDAQLQYRLSFSPLTRQYRLAHGGLAQSFESLESALAVLRRLSNWRVADSSALDLPHLHARIRLRLDTFMLPKPFQVNALTDQDWDLVSDWADAALPGDAGAR
jgi:hypothetical protein